MLMSKSGPAAFNSCPEKPRNLHTAKIAGLQAPMVLTVHTTARSGRLPLRQNKSAGNNEFLCLGIVGFGHESLRPPKGESISRILSASRIECQTTRWRPLEKEECLSPVQQDRLAHGHSQEVQFTDVIRRIPIISAAIFLAFQPVGFQFRSRTFQEFQLKSNLLLARLPCKKSN